MLRPVTRLHASLLATLLLVACTKDSASGANTDGEAGPDAQTDPKPKLGADGQPLGQLSAAEYIDLGALVNKTPEQVEAVLGEPSDTGSDRISCVRFVPDRVFFSCEQEIRVYPHKQFELIRVEYEDGRAALVGISGLPGDGPFDHRAALTAMGVAVPGEPTHDSPSVDRAGSDDVVDRWEWGNSQARLRVDGLEHRVRLSVVNGDWRRAKLEIINNHPLTPAQQERVKPIRGAE